MKKEKQKLKIKSNLPRNFFIVLTLLFIFRYIKIFWEYSFDLEVLRYYRLESFAYILVFLIIFFNFISLLAIFKYKLWWFKTFVVAIVLQLLESTIVLLCLVCDKAVFKIVYNKNILANRLDLDFLEQFFTLKYLLAYLIFILILATVILLLAFRRRKEVVQK